MKYNFKAVKKALFNKVGLDIEKPADIRKGGEYTIVNQKNDSICNFKTLKEIIEEYNLQEELERNNRGGAREGSGRKKTIGGKINKSFKLNKELFEKFEQIIEGSLTSNLESAIELYIKKLKEG